jgi:hypothetical protein
MKDFVPLAASIYLLKQDVVRLLASGSTMSAGLATPNLVTCRDTL